jgi:predicted Zn-ribbon and HTH transcriptional regulator
MVAQSLRHDADLVVDEFAMKTILLRMLHRQPSTCSNCGRQLNERKRKPCPTCHGMARTIAVYAHDQLAAVDKAN